MTKQELIQKDELGQVWTPRDIAFEMAREALGVSRNAERILDPACGPATFSFALHNAGAKNIDLVCYDVDARMQKIAAKTNRALGFKGKAKLADYLSDTGLERTFDIVIMNPPYIRQESIKKTNKERYHQYLTQKYKEKIDKRSNLFILFLLKGLLDLKPKGVLCAIVYDAISQTGYGKEALDLLTQHAEMLSSKHIKMPFENVLVDAQILLFRKRQHVFKVPVSFNKKSEDKLTSLNKLIDARRGTCFPSRKLFLANPHDPHINCAAPIFIKQRSITGLVIKPDQKAYLANSPNHAKVLKWLCGKSGKRFPLSKMSIHGVSGPIVFNYYVRKAPRHLWNPKNLAVSDNFYVSATKNDFPDEVAWFLLNSDIYLSKLQAAARNQGNGLLKLQLYEYKNVRVPDWNRLPKRKITYLSKLAKDLISNEVSYEAVRRHADKATRGLFNA